MIKEKSVLLSKTIAESSLRIDVDYATNVLSRLKNEYVKFSDIFEIVPKKQVDLDEIASPFKYCQIGDVDSKNNKFFKMIDFDNELPDLIDYYKKIKSGDIFLPEKNSILISKVRPYLRKIVFVGEDDIYYTTAFICLRPKIEPIIAYYYLYFVFSTDINIASRQGKGYPTIKDDDLLNLNILKKDFNKALEDSKNQELIKEISQINSELSELRKNLLDENKEIDSIILDQLKIDISPFYEKCKNKKYVKPISKVVDNYDIRCSAKFNRPSKDLLYKIELDNGFIELKNILKKDGELGKSVSPEDFVEESNDLFYISMADISSYKINELGLKNVSEDYYNDNSQKSICKNDILITRSGEGGIGKVAFVENEIDAIFCDFIIRLQIKDVYNSEFLYFYMRSIFFRYFVETNKKGLGNNTNIFPNQVQYFLVPNISLEKQKTICDLIKKELEANFALNSKIDESLIKIESVIMK